MINNLFWNVYKQLERELLSFAENIYIDDTQINIYSMAIADRLVQTCIEIEALSKELYKQEGGTNSLNKAYFDKDCLNHLEQKWHLGEKAVMVTTTHLYLSNADNLLLHPLYEANLIKKCDWKLAYQAVKHNRMNCLKDGTLKNFIRAMAALYLLNIYYQDQVIYLDNNLHNLDSTFGSTFFSLKVHKFPGIDATKEYKKNKDFAECAYLIKASDESWDNARKAVEQLDNSTIKPAIQQTIEDIKRGLIKLDMVQTCFEKHRIEMAKRLNTIVPRETMNLIIKALNGIRYEAVLNK